MIMQAVSTEKALKAIGPYSQAMIAGECLYTSGQIPIDPATGLVVENDIEIQGRQAMENLKNLLEAAGSGMDKVVKTVVYITDLNNFTAMNQIYAAYFAEPYPARSCVEVSRLPKDVLVEIEAVALLK